MTGDNNLQLFRMTLGDRCVNIDAVAQSLKTSDRKPLTDSLELVGQQLYRPGYPLIGAVRNTRNNGYVSSTPTRSRTVAAGASGGPDAYDAIW